MMTTPSKITATRLNNGHVRLSDGTSMYKWFDDPAPCTYAPVCGAPAHWRRVNSGGTWLHGYNVRCPLHGGYLTPEVIAEDYNK